MAEVKHYSGRTYGKAQQESAASKAFDEVFAKPKNTKWGNVSYMKSRKDGEFEKKQKADDHEEEEADPFSFEFDTEKPAKKKPTVKLASRSVVMHPAVRITSSLSSKSPAKSSPVMKTAFDDDGIVNDMTVKKVNTRTYSSRAGRKIKQEHDISQTRIEKYMASENKPANTSTDSSQGTSLSSSENAEVHDLTEDTDEGLYIEPDDGSSNVSSHDEIFTIKDEKEDIFTRPKREPQSMISSEGDEITVRFRSQYLNPEVYSKFTENIKPKDPVGNLANSKVVHKNVLKHDTGTTLIVVCSPKVGDSDIKQTNTQSKYFKDNIKDIVKSKKKPIQRFSKAKKGKQQAEEKDPFDMDDDPDYSPAGAGPHDESESPIPTSSTGDELTSSKESYTTRSGRVIRSSKVAQDSPEAPQTDVEEIVKSVKTAPPRKYHRIFRSRNKGYMDPKDEAEELRLQEEARALEEVRLQEKADKAAAIAAAKAIADSEAESSTQENGDSAVAGESMETDETTQDKPSSEQTENSEKVESDIDSSQQSNITDSQGSNVTDSQGSNLTDSQGADNESSSQETEEPQRKKVKMAKPPPAERKIFRARGNKETKPGALKKIFSSPKKAAAVYNVRSWQDEEEMPDIPKTAAAPKLTSMSPPALPEPPKLKPVVKKAAATAVNKPKQPAEMPRLTRAVHWQRHQDDDAYTSVHVNKEHRDLFTVVKNVKEAHECQEHGETQEFDDDIEYLLAGIEPLEPMSTRCLSCVGLAQKCTMAAFRMHLRAHGTVTKIFNCLQDAAADPSLALCTSALMFMLSRDRLNMDLEQGSLNLMLRLLGVDQQDEMYTTLSPTAERALKRNKDRVLEVYKEFLQQSGTKQDSIDTECLSTGNLAMESLLSLTSRRAGEWFKEELRSLGALDHIVDTVCSCIDLVGDKVAVLTNGNIENLKKVDRCLRVLENVTYLNADNQNYLVSYKDTCLIPSLSRALETCRTCLAIYPLPENTTGKVDKESFGWVIYSCILAILRVLLNLTHDNDSGCVKIGEQVNVIETVLLSILQSPQYVPVDLRFDLYVLSLGLLINLVEHSDGNRTQLLNMKTQSLYEDKSTDTTVLAYLSLVEVFKRREEAAQQLEEADEPKTPEKSPNKSGEWHESDSGMEWVVDSDKKASAKKGDDKDLDDEETFTKALHKAGKHMENSIVAAYVALLVGVLIQEDEDCKMCVKMNLADNTFEGMIYMLKKFLGFMNLTSGTGSAGGKSIERVIEIMEKC